MSAGHDQTDGRQRDARVGEPDGEDVTLYVVDADVGNAQRVAQGLGVGDADEQTADQAGPARHGDAIEPVVTDTGLRQSLLDDGLYGPDVRARGVLRHDPAELGVYEL